MDALWPLIAAPLLQTASACPADMVHVQGMHHEEVQRVCTDYRSRRGKKKRCWSFIPGLVLTEPRHTAIDVCMDRYEWPNKKGENPIVMDRFVDAENKCAEVGKRLCTEFEWEKACEGPHNLPWPYGYTQRDDACNVDKMYWAHDEVKLASNDPAVRMQETRRLWQGAASGSYPACKSAFGVMDLTGNVEEWVATSRPQWPHRSSLKGGYWSKKHAACRGTNESHGPQFRFYEVGFRCCADPKHAPKRQSSATVDSPHSAISLTAVTPFAAAHTSSGVIQLSGTGTFGIR